MNYGGSYYTQPRIKTKNGLTVDANHIISYPTHKVFLCQNRIVITNLDNEEILNYDVLNISLDQVQ